MNSKKHIYLSLLRGINVSGQKIIKMADLALLYKDLGFNEISTYLQSGNVIFTCPNNEPAGLVDHIEAAIKHRFGFDVTVIIRTQQELRQIIETNPFLGRQEINPDKLHVTFLRQLPSDAELGQLDIPNAGLDEFMVREREVFLFCPNGYGRTKLTNNVFEKRLKTPATTRNWKTIIALFDMTKQLEK